jgi:hypothetical protein
MVNNTNPDAEEANVLPAVYGAYTHPGPAAIALEITSDMDERLTYLL